MKYLDYSGLTYFYNKLKKYVDAQINGIDIPDVVIEDGIIEVTYSQLKNLISTNKLSVGKNYRITDYNFIANTNLQIESGNHAFDIIVTAISSNKINENAKAIQHKGDTYFANNNLAAWEIKYDINNDTNKYSWATSDSKGIIFYLKDEFNNVACYDFKNVIYRTLTNNVKFEDKLLSYINSTDGITKFYTFAGVHQTSKAIVDMSKYGFVYNNNIAVYTAKNDKKIRVQNLPFIGVFCMYTDINNIGTSGANNNIISGTNVYLTGNDNNFSDVSYSSINGNNNVLKQFNYGYINGSENYCFSCNEVELKGYSCNINYCNNSIFSTSNLIANHNAFINFNDERATGENSRSSFTKIDSGIQGEYKNILTLSTTASKGTFVHFKNSNTVETTI